MRPLELEKNNTTVSALCLGTMHFGTLTDEGASFKILDRFVEAGGNFIDTANNYATWAPGGRGGESESLLGKWIKMRGNRSRLFLATKVGFPVPADKVGMGLKAKQIESECNNSLKRLGIDTIDLYYAHHDDRETPLEESLNAFQKLIKAGKVRFIGASNYTSWRLEETRWVAQGGGFPEFCCLQQRVSYLRPVSGAEFDPQVVAGRELYDYCLIRNLRLLAYSPLLGGVYNVNNDRLDPRYQSTENTMRMYTLRQVAEESGVTAGQLVLAWLMQSKPEVIPVLGVSNREQLDENLDALKIRLSEDQINRLSSAGNIVSPHIDAKRETGRFLEKT